MVRFSKETIFDVTLASSLALVLALHYLDIYPVSKSIFIFLAVIGILPVFMSALESLKRKHINIDLLASVALIFSYVAGEWYSAGFINLMLSFARLFDRWTEIRTGKLIDKLLKYRPETVRLKKNGQIIEIKIEDVQVGDHVIVETGGRIPVDGSVISGQASLNESSLTGESELVVKKVGDPVFTATLNESGSIVIKAEKVGKDSRLEKIVNLVKQASRAKAHTEKIADKFTQWYIIIVFSGALILYIFTNNLNLILAVLLVVCADDIAVALPLSFTATIARSAQLGILIKGSEVIEKMAHIKYLITDKTGTLTKGKPQIANIESFAGTSVAQFNQYLSTVVAGSRHPVNRAIGQYLAAANVTSQSADSYHESPGGGLAANIGKDKLIVGKLSYLKSMGVVVTDKENKYFEQLQSKGFGLSVLAKNKKVIGVVAMEDGIKSNAKKVIDETKRLGIQKWVMLTGDNEVVASRVSKELDIDEYHASVSPEDKYYFVQKLKKSSPGVLAVMGDGVNDSAALALADVSIAMGSIGSDAAIEAADVALMTDNLEKIPEAILISRENVKIIKQIFTIWAITNSLGLILVFTGVLDPSKAAAYNFITDFFPIINTLRLNLYKPHDESQE